jgi:hypothetical protein
MTTQAICAIWPAGNKVPGMLTAQSPLGHAVREEGRLLSQGLRPQKLRGMPGRKTGVHGSVPHVEGIAHLTGPGLHGTPEAVQEDGGEDEDQHGVASAPGGRGETSSASAARTRMSLAPSGYCPALQRDSRGWGMPVRREISHWLRPDSRSRVRMEVVSCVLMPHSMCACIG